MTEAMRLVILIEEQPDDDARARLLRERQAKAQEQEKQALLNLLKAFATQIQPSRLLLMSREPLDDLPIEPFILRGMGQEDFLALTARYIPDFLFNRIKHRFFPPDRAERSG